MAAVAALLLATAWMNACGFRGPLYLPEEAPAAEQAPAQVDPGASPADEANGEDESDEEKDDDDDERDPSR